MKRSEQKEGKVSMSKKNVLVAIILTVVLTSMILGVVLNAASTDYTYGVSVSNSKGTIWFKSNVSTTWVDVHYKVNSGNQLNYRMTYNSSNSRYENTLNVVNGNVITYSFTYNNANPAYDTEWFSYTVGSTVTVPGTKVPVATSTPVNTSSSGNYTLKWSDEFNGSAINTSNWTYDIGGTGWGNNELEYYTNRSQNASVQNGNLVINAIKESYSGMNYTSARLKTKGLRSWTYGKVEARIKIPTGQGLWPAFWMLGNNIDSVSWPACGEIDIMEHVNNAAAINGTIHWSDTNNSYAYYGGITGTVDFSLFHTYSIEWNSSAIIWYIDGTKFWEANVLNGINGTDEFHRPFFILINLAVGGNWPGSPNESTKFPAQMLVDYVRVYQK